MKAQNTYFDPDTSFFELKIVRLTALSIISIFLLVCGIIVHQSSLWGEWNFTYSGFNHLLDYFKVPLGFLALMIPVGAVFAANHRSEQTKQQLALIRQQNLFTNYYKHIEEFEKFTDKRLESVLEHIAFDNLRNIETTAFDNRQYHKALFPDLLATGNTKVDSTFLSKLEEHFNISTLLTVNNVDSIEKANLFFLELLKNIEPILTSHHLSLGKFMLEGVTLKDILIRNYMKTQLKLIGKEESEDITEKCRCYSTIDSIERIHAILKIIDTCARFDTSYETMKCLQNIERLKKSITLGSISKLNYISKDGIAKVMRVQLFSDDETPGGVPFETPENRVCSQTLEFSIQHGIRDSINQYAYSTHDSPLTTGIT